MTARPPVPTPFRSSASPPRAAGEVWRFRSLIGHLMVRNLKVKYQRSVLGFLWTLLNPLATVAVLIVVFTHIVRIPVVDYWAFLLSGYFAWNFMYQVLTSAPLVLREHAALHRSVAFPPESSLLAAAGSRLVEFAVELGIALVLLVAFHHRAVPASYALLPVLVILQVLIAVGLALGIATVAAFYADIQHVIPILALMLFYVSPVFYPAALVPETARHLYAANPMAGMLTLYHNVLYEGAFPSASLLATTTLAAVVVWSAGYAIFNRHKPVFAELV